MNNYDVIVIGAGPGGYIAALNCALNGLNTAVIEKNDVGGTCLNRGCIPTKAILASAKLLHNISNAHNFGITIEKPKIDFLKIMERKNSIVENLRKGIETLFKSYGVTLYKEKAEFIDKNTIKSGNDILKAENIIIATGSKPSNIGNFKLNKKTIISSDEALELKELPKSLAIIGGGVIGVEFATAFSQFGVNVTIIELEKQILPTEDKSISSRLKSTLKKNGVQIYNNCTAEKIIENEDNIIIELNNKKTVEVEKVLISVGRKRVFDDLGIENINIKTENNMIKVNEKFQTSIPNIYAIGDVASKIMLAHWASAQGKYVADIISKKEVKFPKFCPGCVYTIPEIASFGMNEKTLKEKEINYKAGMFSFKALGKAQAVSETDGMVKIFSNENGKILGASLMGENVTELIHEIIIAAENNISVHQLAETIHAHPTLSEAVMECSHDVFGKCVHLPKKKN